MDEKTVANAEKGPGLGDANDLINCTPSMALTGQRYGKLTIIEATDKRSGLPVSALASSESFPPLLVELGA